MNKNIKYSQNFLTSEKVLNQIIKQLNLKETDTVYEIGTGKGHLTTKLAKISKQVITYHKSQVINHKSLVICDS